MASTFRTSPATVPVTFTFKSFSLLSFLSAVRVRALPASSNLRNLPSAVTRPYPLREHATAHSRVCPARSLPRHMISTTVPDSVSAAAILTSSANRQTARFMLLLCTYEDAIGTGAGVRDGVRGRYRVEGEARL